MFRITVLFALLVPAHAIFAQPSRPLHERETQAAWTALQDRNYVAAIKHADNCIVEFWGNATRRQKELTESRAEIPVGRVTAAQKATIHQSGPLNDVCTCFYIKARAAHKLGQKDDFTKALDEVAKLAAARAWDPVGQFFWAPSDAGELLRFHPELAEKSVHEAYVTLAWAALNRGDHAKAAEYADKCVANFHTAALEMERDLVRRNVRIPTGAVDDATKKAIHANGVLNDIGTLLFIKGKASEARGDKKAAITAYEAAVSLQHCRCWDENGWFWSPPEGSGDRLSIIR
jgi:tetratricopeptide (TPR) repeat protein